MLRTLNTWPYKLHFYLDMSLNKLTAKRKLFYRKVPTNWRSNLNFCHEDADHVGHPRSLARHGVLKMNH